MWVTKFFQVYFPKDNKDMKYEPLDKLPELLKDSEYTSVPSAWVAPEKVDYLDLMCKAIKKHEGWFEGSRSWRNKNPGNIRKGQWSLAIGYDKDNFAIFKTEEDGMKTLKTMITNAATGKSNIYNPDMSLVNFFKKYAPSFENDTHRYSSVVGEYMKVNPFTFKLKDLLV